MDLTEKEKDARINSDLNFKTIASHNFDKIIEYVKKSNLNFHIQQSPFTAFISVKKSFIKDINGRDIASTLLDSKCLTCEALSGSKTELEAEVHSLKSVNKKLVEDVAETNRKLNDLKSEQLLEVKEEKHEMEDLQFELRELKRNNINLQDKINLLHQEISHLEYKKTET